MPDVSEAVAAIGAEHPGGVRADAVAAEAGITVASARTTLARLADAGQAERLGRGLYGPPGERNNLPHLRAVPVTSADAEHNSGAELPHGNVTNATGLGVETGENITAAPPRHCPWCSALVLDPAAGRCGWCGWSLAAVFAPGAVQ
ncbi:MAG: hypothetical protein ACYCVZ_07845 [Streptosporangiaceae bacterium]